MLGTTDRSTRRRRLGLVLAVVALGAAVRLLTWGQVFTPQGTRFVGDNDPIYHVLRAERIVEHYPKVPWTDPNLNYPAGAVIPWPPLFDELIAAAAMVVGRGHPTHAQLEQAAAFVPMAIGAVTLPLVIALGTILFEWEVGLAAAIFLALLPAHVRFSLLGRPDQHVAELFVFTWILLAFAHGWSGKEGRSAGGWLASTALGAGIAVAFWTWQGSALDLVVPAIFAAAWHLAAPPGDEVGSRMNSTLARGGAIGAGLLVVSAALFGRPGALFSMRLDGITGVQPLIAIIASAFAALLNWVPRWLPGRDGASRRLATLALAGALPVTLAIAISPAFRGGLGQGLVALGAANPWYARINEFRPILDKRRGIWDGVSTVASEFGIGPLLMALTVPILLARWNERREERPATLLLGTLAAGFLALTATRVRFALYLCLPMVLCAAVFVREARTTLSRRLPYLAYAIGAVVLAANAVLNRPIMPPAVTDDLLHTLEWLRGESSPADQTAVLSRWYCGHAIQYYGRKPVIVSPFGTEGGDGAMEDAATFYFSTAPSVANNVLDRRRVGFLLLANPLNDTLYLDGFAPAGTPQVTRTSRRWLRGESAEATEAFWRLVPSRLYFLDGACKEGSAAKALSKYRLLYETPSTGGVNPIDEGQLKVFGVVPGASVIATGEPRVLITATVSLRTNQGRGFTWSTAERADGSGRAVLSLPYATGRNGEVTAGPYVLTVGHTRRELAVSEAAVERGEWIGVVLSKAPAEPQRLTATGGVR